MGKKLLILVVLLGGCAKSQESREESARKLLSRCLPEKWYVCTCSINCFGEWAIVLRQQVEGDFYIFYMNPNDDSDNDVAIQKNAELIRIYSLEEPSRVRLKLNTTPFDKPMDDWLETQVNEAIPVVLKAIKY